MKKIMTVLAIAIFAINASAQEKPVAKEKAKTECKVEAKKCDASMAKSEGKKCCAKKA